MTFPEAHFRFFQLVISKLAKNELEGIPASTIHSTVKERLGKALPTVKGDVSATTRLEVLLKELDK